jgi:Trk K+ transport system NAD-binding subunit
MLENIEPREDIVLSSGDIIVILGLQADLNIFEKYVINGNK